MKTEVFRGWGLKVGGHRPYLGCALAWSRDKIPFTEPYHHPVKVVVVPLAEWQRLKRLDKAVKNSDSIILPRKK